MTKLTRYNLGEIYRTYSSDKHNVVCTAYDVEKLEAKCAELESKCAELLEALEVFLEYNDQGGPLSFNTDAMWAQARTAIAKAKGEAL